MNNILYLASGSKSRRKLLEEAKIPFKVISQSSTEECSTDCNDASKIVLEIAKDKMKCVNMSSVPKDKPAFVITADSLIQGMKSKEIFGKPKSLEDAKIRLTTQYNQPILVPTGCCLEKRIFENDNWITEKQITWTTTSEIEFEIPPNLVDAYIAEHRDIVLGTAGACTIEGYSQQFLKSINGSYSGTLGLAMYELRKNLEKVGFFFS
jgi:septum formation protein